MSNESQPDREERINRILAEYRAAKDEGQSPDVASLLQHNPNLAELMDNDHWLQNLVPGNGCIYLLRGGGSAVKR